ncbi:MAG: hypothetical protein U1E89_16475 [Burkholderiaceae bacterium]
MSRRQRTPLQRCAAHRWVLCAAAALAACSTSPPPPDWRANAQGAIAHANTAYLQGNAALAASEFERARREIASTGRPDLLARAELMRCAAHAASLQVEPCAGFEAVRADAAPPERAYAAYLAAEPTAAEADALPEHHRAVARAATPEAALAAVRGIDDPLARLVGAAVALRTRRANPELLTLAVDTASAQGWRRPLLAWLGVQAQRAEAAGDSAALAQIRRRMALAGSTP